MSSKKIELHEEKASGSDQVPSYKSVDFDTHKKIMLGIRDELRDHIQKQHLVDVLRYLGFLPSDIDDLNQDHDNSTRGFTVRTFDLMITTRGQDDVNPTKLVEAFKNAQNKECADAIKRYCDKNSIECEDARRETQCADDVTESLDNIVTGLGGETANQSSMSSSPSFVKQVHDEKTESHQTTENLSLHKLSDTYVISQPSKNSPHEVTQNILKVKKASPSTNHQSLQGDSGKYANAAISNEVLCNEVNVHPDESLPLLPQHSRGDGGNVSRRVDTPRKIHDVATYRKIMIGIRDELRSYVQVSLIDETLRYLGFFESEIEDINFNQSGNNRTREITVKGFEMMIRRGEQNVNPSKLIKAFRAAGNNECAEVVKEYCSKNNFPCDDG